MHLMRNANPEWEVVTGPVVLMPMGHLGDKSGEPDSLIEIVDPTQVYPLKTVSMYRDMQSAGMPEYLSLGYDREHVIMQFDTNRFSTDDDGPIN